MARSAAGIVVALIMIGFNPTPGAAQQAWYRCDACDFSMQGFAFCSHGQGNLLDCYQEFMVRCEHHGTCSQTKLDEMAPFGGVPSSVSQIGAETGIMARACDNAAVVRTYSLADAEKVRTELKTLTL